MSQQVIIDYQQIAIQCISICDIAEARLKGDVDGNGKIGTSDSVLLLQYAAEMTVLDEISAESADVNGDKAADTQDAVWILQYASEKTEQ